MNREEYFGWPEVLFVLLIQWPSVVVTLGCLWLWWNE
jgi:hypothetical protein